MKNQNSFNFGNHNKEIKGNNENKTGDNNNGNIKKDN